MAVRSRRPHRHLAGATQERGVELLQNLDRDWVERTFAQVGFQIERLDEIGTEFREYDEERAKPVSENLLRLARLRRK